MVKITKYQQKTILGVVVIILVASLLVAIAMWWFDKKDKEERATWGRVPTIEAVVADRSIEVSFFWSIDMENKRSGDLKSVIVPVSPEQSLVLRFPQELTESYGPIMIIVRGSSPQSKDRRPITQERSLERPTELTIPGKDDHGRPLLGVEVQSKIVTKTTDGEDTALKVAWSIKTSEEAPRPSTTSSAPSR